jgi:anti-sigma regulatory factor (Ser/Thr protein kinase)
MSPAPATGRPGLVHELFLHTSSTEMLEFVAMFAQDGVDAGEPTLLAVRPDTATLVLDSVGSSPYLTVLPAIGQPGRPASDLRDTDALLAGYTAQAPRVRILNQEPAVPAEHWHEWRRLEAVVNLALARHNAWAVCAYDQSALTDDRVEDLCATHPHVWSADQHRPNERYQDPSRFIAAHRDAPPDQVEQTVPTVELINPSPAAARATVSGFTQHSELPAAESEGLIIATSEAVTNGIVHGQPPIVLRLWAQPHEITATVTDTGNGPTDPFVGLLPASYADQQPAEPGLGLWISHQLIDVTHRRHPSGYTIRITAGRPRAPGENNPSHPR